MISRDQLLSDILAAIAPPPDDPGVTIAEYAKAEKIPRKEARRALEHGVGEGTLLLGYAYRARSDGHTCRTRVFRAAPKGKPKRVR